MELLHLERELAGEVVNFPDKNSQVIHTEEQDAIQYLIEENDKLKDQLAAGVADDPETAKQHIEELRDEVNKLKMELTVVTKSRDMYQAECGELRKQVAMYQRQMKKK